MNLDAQAATLELLCARGKTNVYLYICVHVQKRKKRAFLEPTATSRPFAQPDRVSPQIGTIPVWESTGKSSTTTPDSDLTVLSFWGLLKVASPLQTPGPSSCWPSGAPCERGGPSMGGSRVKGFLMVMRATKHVPIDCTAVGQPTTEGAMPKTEPTSLC